jgi:hypothetical protein
MFDAILAAERKQRLLRAIELGLVAASLALLVAGIASIASAEPPARAADRALVSARCR